MTTAQEDHARDIRRGWHERAAAILRGSTGFFIFGAGGLGKTVHKALRNSPALSILDKPFLGFLDNDAKKHRPSNGKEPGVYEPATWLRHQDAAVICCVYQSGRVERQMRFMGCQRVISFPLFFQAFTFENPASAIQHRALEGMALLRACYRDEVEQALALMSDQHSREEYQAQITWRATLDDRVLHPPSNPAEIYFPPFVKQRDDEEVYLDCGAYDGDTIKQFLRWHSGHGPFRVFGVEPNRQNAEKAEKLGYPIARCGLGQKLDYDLLSGEGPGSRLGAGADANTTIVPVLTIDWLFCFAVQPPTYIKMDIEGSEGVALAGAKWTIRKSRPVLAICAYHSQMDFWALPAFVHELAPDYKIAFRRYAEHCWETVVYGVPPERWQGGE